MVREFRRALTAPLRDIDGGSPTTDSAGLKFISPSRTQTYDLAANSGEIGQAIKRRKPRLDNNLAAIRILRSCCNSWHFVALVGGLTIFPGPRCGQSGHFDFRPRKGVSGYSRDQPWPPRGEPVPTVKSGQDRNRRFAVPENNGDGQSSVNPRQEIDP